MGTSVVLSGLVKKRGELAGRIEELKGEMASLTGDVQALDRAIKIYDPTYRIRSIKAKRTRRQSRFFPGHGEGSRFVLDTLRQAHGPLSTNAIADMAIEQKGLDRNDEKAIRACILTTLSRQRKQGVVVEKGRDQSGAIKWALAD